MADNTLTCNNCGESITTPTLFMMATAMQTFDRAAGQMELDFDPGTPALYPFAWLCTECGFILQPEAQTKLDEELRVTSPEFRRFAITIAHRDDPEHLFTYDDTYTEPWR